MPNASVRRELAPTIGRTRLSTCTAIVVRNPRPDHAHSAIELRNRHEEPPHRPRPRPKFLTNGSRSGSNFDGMGRGGLTNDIILPDEGICHDSVSDSRLRMVPLTLEYRVAVSGAMAAQHKPRTYLRLS